MSESIDELQKKLEKNFQDLTEIEKSEDLLAFHTPAEDNLKVLRFLKENQKFYLLTDLCGIHYPEKKGKELAVVYHLHNLVKGLRVRMKVFISVSNPKVFTATSLFESANWMERETYDFFGILFIGHPNLVRILNVDEMTYFPLRKEFPLEDQTRQDKDDEMFGRGGTQSEQFSKP